MVELVIESMQERASEKPFIRPMNVHLFTLRFTVIDKQCFANLIQK